MTTQEKVIKNKAGLLQLARELGCQVFLKLDKSLFFCVSR